MKYLDEYRSEELAQKIVAEIHRTVTKPWVLMEVCGGQTHSIVKYGIDRLLPNEVELVHGPGCPVCVTSLEMIDKAHAIAQRPDVIFCSFGDMLRVPGSKDDLLILKSRGPTRTRKSFFSPSVLRRRRRVMRCLSFRQRSRG